jgi:cephalosporin hydroxylase
VRITIDDQAQTMEIVTGDEIERFPLYSDRSFGHIARLFSKVGWNQRYTYGFTWLGRPIIQLPEDMIRIQELIYRLKPDLIVETGIAHGGSLVFYATLCEAVDHGRVIGVDIDIRQHNRGAIEAHPLARRITMIEGSSTDPKIVARVAGEIDGARVVLVILDSNHTRDHVRAELDAYSRFVTPGSYIVATDGIMEVLTDVPRGRAEWRDDNPAAAAREFADANPAFMIETPPAPFNEGTLAPDVLTHWPSAYLRRL